MKKNHLLKRTEYLVKSARCYLSCDARYKKKRFTEAFGRTPDLDRPRTFNEKTLCRMLYDNNPAYSLLADKLRSRAFIESVLGSQYIVPLLGVYKRFDDIDRKSLPEQFVLKCNHDSASTLICRDKSQFDWQAARQHFDFCLSRNMYVTTREQHYSPIQPRILCESYVDLYQNCNKDVTPELFRIHCFAGNPVIAEVDFTDSLGHQSINLYDMLWNKLDVRVGLPNLERAGIQRPAALSEVLDLSRRLSLNFDYCRLDWFISGERILFSEFTFTPCAGKMAFAPAEFDLQMGDFWPQPAFEVATGFALSRKLRALFKSLPSLRVRMPRSV